MTTHESAARITCKCGGPLSACDCGGQACPGWYHAGGRSGGHWCRDGSRAYLRDGDLVPGWHDSPQGRADAADQARWDRQETRTNG